MGITIRPYQAADERHWVYTKALAYLFSPFFDDQETTKTILDPEVYQAACELVAIDDATQQLVGLLDIGVFTQEMSEDNLYFPTRRLAYWENFAVHPDWQHRGIGTQLFMAAKAYLVAHAVQALIIFTRDDAGTNQLYQKFGARLLTRDYLVIGTPKADDLQLGFRVDRAQQRLILTNRQTGQPLTHYLREGVYIVTDKAAVGEFDAERVITEHSYVLELTDHG
ncbi:MAG: GNAT family N-acetyltransferase [Schleiferilactobacillus harbinensis]|jgi:GNAT superfamily N-acetyltransferase